MGGAFRLELNSRLEYWLAFAPTDQTKLPGISSDMHRWMEISPIPRIEATTTTAGTFTSLSFLPPYPTLIHEHNKFYFHIQYGPSHKKEKMSFSLTFRFLLENKPIT